MDNSSNLSEFKPTDNMHCFLDMAVKTLSTNTAELCRDTGIDESTYYKWKKNEQFNEWFNSEWKKHTLDLKWKIEAVGLRNALKGDFKFWKAIQEYFISKESEDKKIEVVIKDYV